MLSLYGSLARKFEKKYNRSAKNIDIKVKSVEEAMRAMSANFKGFRQLIKKSGYYRITRGNTLVNGKDIPEQELEMKFGEKHFHFMPVAAGCGGNSGMLQMVLGAVLIVVGVILIKTPVGAPLIMMGASMMLGGLMMMLSPAPSIPTYKDREKPDERASYIFDGPRNRAAAGATIPLVYGETFIGSVFVSGGLKITDEVVN